MASTIGILIAVEGIDGAGKTTQVQLIRRPVEAAGETVVVSKEPTDGKWGQMIRSSAKHGRMSLDEEINAFIEDRKEHIAEVIQPALDRGDVIILDRYYFSTIAYQGARGAGVEELSARMRELSPQPDVCLLLDVDPKLGLHRVSSSRGDTPNEFEQEEQLSKVRSIFNELACTDPLIVTIDGRPSVSDVNWAVMNTLVDTAFKSKRCAKPWGCDELLCRYKAAGTCAWWNLRRPLLSVPPE